MKKNNPHPVPFVLADIILSQFAILEENFDQDKDFDLYIDVRFSYDAERKIIIPFVAVTYAQNNIPLLKIESGNVFYFIPEFLEEIQRDRQLIIPAGLARHLIMLTIGTLRGILFAKTEHTPFHHKVLPTINVTELIQEDVVLDL